jgi:hypothetical protein
MSQTSVSRDNVAWFVSIVSAAQTEGVVMDCEIHCGDKIIDAKNSRNTGSIGNPLVTYGRDCPTHKYQWRADRY